MRYVNIRQAGKEQLSVGNILINQKEISNYDFGGTFLYNDSFIILPVYIKGFFTSGFKIALINLKNEDIQIKGKKNKVVFLSEVRNNKVYYYEDFDKKQINSIEIISKNKNRFIWQH